MTVIMRTIDCREAVETWCIKEGNIQWQLAKIFTDFNLLKLDLQLSQFHIQTRNFTFVTYKLTRKTRKDQLCYLIGIDKQHPQFENYQN